MRVPRRIAWVRIGLSALVPIRADILTEVKIPAWRFISRSWRHVGGTATLLVVCVGVIVASKGPSSAALQSWARDEVVLFGSGNANAGGHRDFSVLLSVKNVAGLEYGLYEVRQPKSWDTAPRRHGDDGVDEVVLETPLSLISARNSGEWHWWDIKISQVAPSRARNRVSSFFTRTTGDGSVPGEFRRLGVSIVRDSNRVYRLILWGEDPDTDHWLRIGLLPLGRGTQSSLRTIAKAFLLPVALAVDVAVIPLACAVVWAGLFLATGRSVPMTLTVLGVVFLAAYPLVRISEVRERADIHRALSPLVDAPLDSLRSTAGREFELTVPNDSQWRRIVRRMGPPAFLAVPATTEEMRNRQTYAASDVGLSLRVTRNGSPVTLTPTSDTPYAYSAYTQNNGFKFTAEAGDRIALWTRVTGSQLPPKSNLILVADWGNLNTWDWVDGAAMGYGVLTLLSSVAAALGLALIGGGVVIGWPRRSRSALM
jgi:hypothetical protein